ncbi:HmuY family protein [Leptospira ilyithenensis]|uniref:Heme-binding protein HmuY n=1 Tax=Leptospira ilyithenensis TaxID=2484901 RepID=A0A4R9LRT9_9LEPT|nr:HmuY family protein [Leptospira ilyithenensis]TGN13726.1 heme-binding protein HmuY [Leptospira ilyithenensis]
MKFLKLIPIVLFGLFAINCPKEKTTDDGSAAALLLLVSDSTKVIPGITINATSSSEWAHVNLKSADPSVTVTNSDAWDVRFKRFVIATNSGTSGSKNGGSCELATSDYDDTTISSSSCTIVVDSLQSQTGDGGFGSANENASPSMFLWYSYDGTTHILSSKKKVYLIRGSDGTSYFKFQMLDYYSLAGTSGYPKFRFQKL